MKEKGYFVFIHEIRGVNVCFVKYSKESEQLFKDFHESYQKSDDEKVMDLWFDFNELEAENGDISITCWDEDKWIFNDCEIFDAFIIYEY